MNYYYCRPLSATTPKSSVPFSKAFQTHTHTPIPQNPIPQSFMRVSKDTESSCARTDLVYVHPSPEERKALAQPQKVFNYYLLIMHSFYSMYFYTVPCTVVHGLWLNFAKNKKG